jgi:hypothetical protein
MAFVCSCTSRHFIPVFDADPFLAKDRHDTFFVRATGGDGRTKQKERIQDPLGLVGAGSMHVPLYVRLLIVFHAFLACEQSNIVPSGVECRVPCLAMIQWKQGSFDSMRGRKKLPEQHQTLYLRGGGPKWTSGRSNRGGGHVDASDDDDEGGMDYEDMAQLGISLKNNKETKTSRDKAGSRSKSDKGNSLRREQQQPRKEKLSASSDRKNSDKNKSSKQKSQSPRAKGRKTRSSSSESSSSSGDDDKSGSDDEFDHTKDAAMSDLEF